MFLIEKNISVDKPLTLRTIRDGPLEKLWGGGEEGNFRAAGIFFLLSNSLYEYFLGHSMNIF